MTHREEFRNGSFARLITDRAGNTLAIVAAATLPMVALIGGGVDVSRAYMAKTQLQAACDAGVLAGRRAMAKSGEYNTAERTKANSMFNFNFDGNTVNASGVSFETDDNDEGQVTGTATADVPTAVMYIFGKTEIPLEVGCMAELQLANVDVMFVLDTTGSMAGTKIQGLRDAVRDFHKTIAEAVTDDETRVRYGFVPYSTTVNAKELLTSGKMPTSYFRNDTPYQTRVALFNTEGSVVGNVSSSEKTYTDTRYNRSDCRDKSEQLVSSSGSAPNDVTTVTHKWDWIGNRTSGYCQRTETTKVTSYRKVYYFTRWRYKQASVNTSTFRGFSDVSIATSLSTSSSYIYASDIDAAHSSREYTVEELARMTIPGMGKSTSPQWNGCIQERDTVQTDDFTPVPDDAYDLDINLTPESEETRWRPMWPAIAYYRSPGVTVANSGTVPTAYCPAPMKLFRDIDLTGTSTDVPDWLDDYLDDDLVAVGNTYHDIGMIWGARLGSPHGIFEDNVNADDPKNVSRHLIFMTDGKMEPNRERLTAYGIEQSDNRIGPVDASDSDLALLHGLRFRVACDAAKKEGYTIYVVGFGTSITDDLKYCSSGGRYYYSSNTTQLRNTFKFIASQVADLRLGA